MLKSTFFAEAHQHRFASMLNNWARACCIIFFD